MSTNLPSDRLPSNDLPSDNLPSSRLPSPELLMTQFLLWMRMRGCSERTVELWTGNIERFIGWSAERGIDCVSQVTPEILAAYRRALFHYRKAKTNKPLRFATQVSYLTSVRRWFVWLAREKFIPGDPARDLELPKEEQRLPHGVPFGRRGGNGAQPDRRHDGRGSPRPCDPGDLLLNGASL